MPRLRRVCARQRAYGCAPFGIMVSVRPKSGSLPCLRSPPGGLTARVGVCNMPDEDELDDVVGRAPAGANRTGPPAAGSNLCSATSKDGSAESDGENGSPRDYSRRYRARLCNASHDLVRIALRALALMGDARQALERARAARVAEGLTGGVDESALIARLDFLRGQAERRVRMYEELVPHRSELRMSWSSDEEADGDAAAAAEGGRGIQKRASLAAAQGLLESAPRSVRPSGIADASAARAARPASAGSAFGAPGAASRASLHVIAKYDAELHPDRGAGPYPPPAVSRLPPPHWYGSPDDGPGWWPGFQQRFGPVPVGAVPAAQVPLWQGAPQPSSFAPFADAPPAVDSQDQPDLPCTEATRALGRPATDAKAPLHMPPPARGAHFGYPYAYAPGFLRSSPFAPPLPYPPGAFPPYHIPPSRGPPPPPVMPSAHGVPYGMPSPYQGAWPPSLWPWSGVPVPTDPSADLDAAARETMLAVYSAMWAAAGRPRPRFGAPLAPRGPPPDA